MDHDHRSQLYENLALREEKAAALADTDISASLHQAMAKMYRHEAAKANSVRNFLTLVSKG